MKVFLDDCRFPTDCITYMHQRIGKLNPIYLEEWAIAKDYADFKDEIINAHLKNIKITHISFDHDLGEDKAKELVQLGVSKRKARASKKQMKSGYDAAKWLLTFYREKELELPIIFVHSMNPIGTQNIINLFKSNENI